MNGIGNEMRGVKWKENKTEIAVDNASTTETDETHDPSTRHLFFLLLRYPNTLSLDLKHLDIEHQLRVRRYLALAPGPVGQVRRDGDASLAADRHADHANVPASDHLAGAELERKWRAFFVRFLSGPWVSLCVFH